MTREGWAAPELRYAQLGDTRRNKRLVRIIEDLAAQPNESVPQACGDWAATKATYECKEITSDQANMIFALLTRKAQ